MTVKEFKEYLVRENIPDDAILTYVNNANDWDTIETESIMHYRETAQRNHDKVIVCLE